MVVEEVLPNFHLNREVRRDCFVENVIKRNVTNRDPSARKETALDSKEIGLAVHVAVPSPHSHLNHATPQTLNALIASSRVREARASIQNVLS